MTSTAEYTLTTDAPKRIIVSGDNLGAFSDVLPGKLHEQQFEVAFTKENALALRRLLRGRDVFISQKDKAVLGFLADVVPDGTDPATYEWSVSLIDLANLPLTGKFGKVKTQWDLLHYLPLRFIDKSNPQQVGELELGGWGVIVGQIAADVKYDTFRQLVKIVVEDVSGKRLSASFFGKQQRWREFKFKKGDEVVLYGNYSEYVNKRGDRFPQITNASIDKLTDVQGSLPMIPVYPQKSGDKTRQLQREIYELLEKIVWFEDPVPEAILTRYNLMPRNEAYRKLHFPLNREDADRARERLAFDEFVRLQVYFHLRKGNIEKMHGTAKPRGDLRDMFIDSLPFTLTGAQARVIAEISQDMAAETPMYRLLQGEVGSGKAQPLDSLVLTREGFKIMGDMQVGDEVLTPDGGQSRVAAIYPQGKRPIYELTFRDGTKVKADQDHLWAVRTTGKKFLDRPHKLLRTAEIADDLLLKNGSPKWYVDYPTINHMGTAWGSIIHPYILGALLGDGSLGTAGVRFTVGEDGLDIIDRMQTMVPENLHWRRAQTTINVNTGKETYDYWLVKNRPDLDMLPVANLDNLSDHTVAALHQKGYTQKAIATSFGISVESLAQKTHYNFDKGRINRNKNIVLDELRQLGLAGLGSHSKYVPPALLNTDNASRLALLQGLLDTDGSVEPGRAYSFASVSKQLAEDVAYLARSLGGVAKVTRKVRKSGLSWSVYGRLPEPYVPFLLNHKKALYKTMQPRVPASKAILSIEYVGEEEAQCIKLENPQGLYITDGFTITHNTEVSTGAALIAVANGSQVAFMAPTDILAGQLHDRLQRDLAKAGFADRVHTRLLSGKPKAAEKREILAGLVDGSVDIVVGTHAVIQKTVKFKDLGLVIIDEQHKFGSEQRTVLRENNKENGAPDMLMMSATPIPRTTSQVLYGDMDISIIDELPPGRTPVATQWDTDTDEAWDRIREQVASGHQAYVVASLVADSENESMADVESATTTYENMQLEFTGYNIGLLHGKLPADEKQAVIDAFYRNETQILVATTVVEVGVNVPNATVMTILNANRFGIASLHQIRGRVGRGAAVSYCYLVGEVTNAEAEERLNAMVASNDGFWLAEKDLEIRGEGSLFSTRQSGMSDNFAANLREHREILERAKRVAGQAAKSKKLAGEVSFLYQDVSISA